VSASSIKDLKVLVETIFSAAGTVCEIPEVKTIIIILIIMIMIIVIITLLVSHGCIHRTSRYTNHTIYASLLIVTSIA
jgi:hypothetical protein